MRLKLLTNLNTLLLISVCLALGATLWWSQQALERPYQLMARYLSLSQTFQNQAARNIEDYLASGDALRLSGASQSLESLLQHLDELPAELTQSLRPSLVDLDAFSKTALLAAGKLAGDPQALLLQAERELGANLSRIKGSGPKERITADDVRSYVKQALAGVQGGAGAAPAAGGSADGAALGLLPWPKVDFAKFGEIEPKPLSRIKKISGANLHRNWVMIPHVTNNDVADITDLEALRVQLNKENEKSGVKVTMLDFVIKAVVSGLKKFP